MDSDAFYRKYREALGGLERRYQETEAGLDANARRAVEVEEQRILDDLSRLLDAPGKARAAAFRDEMADIEKAVAPRRDPATKPTSLDDLEVRPLHLLARLDSSLRHSIVEACLMNLRGFAEVLDERADDPTFVRKVGRQISLLPGVVRQIVDFFGRPILMGLTIRDLLPLPYKGGLAAMRGMLYLVDRFGDPDAKQPPVSGRELAARVDELTEALTGVRKVLDTRRSSLAGTVRQGVEALRPLAEEKGAHLTFSDRTEDDVRLFLNEAHVANAVGELIRNALKHGLEGDVEGPAITVSVVEDAPPSTEVRIVVEDTGQGFAPEVLERLGSEAEAISTSGGGDGLGFVREAAREHFGRVEIDSPPGGGARVSIVLPRHAPIGAKSADPKGAAGPAGS